MGTRRDKNPSSPEAIEGQMLRDLLEAVTESILLVDRHGTIQALNRTAAKRLGRSARAITGTAAAQAASLIDPALIRLRFKVMRKAIRTGKAVRVEEQRAGYIFDSNYYPIVPAKGEVKGLVIFARDITRQRLSEQALRESEARYRALVEGAGEAISVVDGNGVFHYFNEAAARSLGAKPRDLIGRTMWELFPKALAERQADAVRQVISSGTQTNRVVLTEVRGRKRWYNTTIQPLKDGRGKVSRALVVARDIHDLRMAQEELERYKERMGQAERLASVGTLSGMLIHELAQPLTVASLSLGNALASLADAASPATADLQAAMDAMSSVRSILDRFRDFGGTVQKRPAKRVDAEVVVSRTVRLLGHAAEKADLFIRFKGLAGLPRIRSDEGTLEQVVFALIQNAIQAADGRPGQRLTITGSKKDNCIELSFADTCGGIRPEHESRLFEPFFTTKPPGVGMGLGLCIVKRIVTAAGGTVAFKSRWGKGATFTIRWPHVGTFPSKAPQR
jgi:two-component system NtrC family sensor kinase